MADLLLDTDLFVDHLRGARQLKPGGHRISYSTITRCELFAGRHVDEEQLRRLLSPFRELPVSGEIAESAGRIRRATRIRTPDAIIAATALVHVATLVTRDRKHFEDVPRLRVRIAI